MAWRLARSLITLRTEVNTRWPARDRSSDGALGNEAHSARVSDHNPDDAGVVRALDIDDDDTTPEAFGIGRVIAELLRATRDPRIKYLIYHGQICSAYATKLTPEWQWRKYDGPNAHKQHLHVSVVAGALGDDTRPWGVAAPVLTTPPPAPIILEDDMPLTETDKAWFRAVVSEGNAVILAKLGTTVPTLYRDPETGAVYAHDGDDRLWHVDDSQEYADLSSRGWAQESITGAGVDRLAGALNLPSPRWWPPELRRDEDTTAIYLIDREAATIEHLTPARYADVVDDYPPHTPITGEALDELAAVLGISPSPRFVPAPPLPVGDDDLDDLDAPRP